MDKLYPYVPEDGEELCSWLPELVLFKDATCQSGVSRQDTASKASQVDQEAWVEQSTSENGVSAHENDFSDVIPTSGCERKTSGQLLTGVPGVREGAHDESANDNTVLTQLDNNDTLLQTHDACSNSVGDSTLQAPLSVDGLSDSPDAGLSELLDRDTKEASASNNHQGPVLRPRKNNTETVKLQAKDITVKDLNTPPISLVPTPTAPDITEDKQSTKAGPVSKSSPPAALNPKVTRAPVPPMNRPKRVRQPPVRYRRATTSMAAVITSLAQAVVSLAKQSDGNISDCYIC